jgi:short-subunit dehydrogenase
VNDPQHVLVVGAAGAIGQGTARALRARWPRTRLALADRDVAKIEHLAVALGNARVHRVDLAEPDAGTRLVAAAETDGLVDGLVNAAGVMEVAALPALPWAQARDLLTVDLVAPLELMHALTGAWVAAGREGFVANVTSMAGRVPLLGCGFYGAAKAGLSMASEIAHQELRGHGIRVVTVYPGPVRSPLEARARGQYAASWLADRMPMGDPDVLGGRIVDAVARGSARVVYPRWYGAAWWSQRLADRIALGFGPAPRALVQAGDAR